MTLEAYCDFHEKRNYDVFDLRNILHTFSKTDSNKYVSGGTITVCKQEILDSINKNFETLALKRFSIRNFSEGSIDIGLILKAIKIAQKSPSVCNRQSSFVYIIESEELKTKALNYQNGNRGFGHLADKILILTSNLRAFYSIEERNQAFIDGGIFGMSLVYALHSLGLGTCTLNWSASKQRDIELRKAIAIRENEVVIFMIAVGLLPENFDVPCSQRKNLEDVFQII
ncbi:MAG: hypothetical protein F6K57_26360 [Moorea sp. SIO4A5]|nr:hypothetical protein [Moorena sp. SIO4A5]